MTHEILGEIERLRVALQVERAALLARADAAERQVEALRRYVRHKPLCAAAIWSTEETPCPCSRPCSCGAAAALASAGVKP